jgi:hypothetical protein
MQAVRYNAALVPALDASTHYVCNSILASGRFYSYVAKSTNTLYRTSSLTTVRYTQMHSSILFASIRSCDGTEVIIWIDDDRSTTGRRFPHDGALVLYDLECLSVVCVRSNSDSLLRSMPCGPAGRRQ